MGPGVVGLEGARRALTPAHHGDTLRTMSDQRQIRISPAHYAELVRRQRNGQSLRGVLAEVLDRAFDAPDLGVARAASAGAPDVPCP